MHAPNANWLCPPRIGISLTSHRYLGYLFGVLPPYMRIMCHVGVTLF